MSSDTSLLTALFTTPLPAALQALCIAPKIFLIAALGLCVSWSPAADNCWLIAVRSLLASSWPVATASRPSAISPSIWVPFAPAASRISASLGLAWVTKSSMVPAMVAFKWPISTWISESPSSILALLRSSWRTRNNVGRRLMRAAAMVGGAGSTPIRLMPRLTQSSTSRCLLLTRVTTSPSASTRAMMLPTTGKAPATDLMRSRVTVPPLIDCSQASNSAAPRPTSLASMVLSGATATWGSRGLADSLMPAPRGWPEPWPGCSARSAGPDRARS